METSFTSSINLHYGNVLGTINSLSAHFQSLTALNTTTGIHDAIYSFVEPEGERLYLQIYIPFKDQVNLNSVPVILPASYSEGEGIGYRLKPNGAYEAIRVDKAFAQNNLVWVVSANERVDIDGNINIEERGAPPVGPCENGIQDANEEGIDCGGTSGCGPCPPPCENGVQDANESGVDCGGTSGCGPCPPVYVWTRTFKHVVLTGINVTSIKEDWISGQAEFTMVGFQYNFDDNNSWQKLGCLGAPANSSDCGPEFNTYLKKISEDELGVDYTWNTADGPYWRDRNFAWNFGTDYGCPPSYTNGQKTSRLNKNTNFPNNPNYGVGEKIKIVFFERDHSHSRYLTHPLSGSSIKYKSEQAPYAVFDWDYNDFISQCNVPPSQQPPTCVFTSTTYALDGASITLTVKEQWTP